jgi:hypothetical protein
LVLIKKLLNRTLEYYYAKSMKFALVDALDKECLLEDDEEKQKKK